MSGPQNLHALVAGALGAGFLVGAVFFLRFWARTRDGLFLAFCAAFVLLAISQALPTLLGLAREDRPGFYLIRLAAFALIIAAILRKNLAGGRRWR